MNFKIDTSEKLNKREIKGLKLKNKLLGEDIKSLRKEIGKIEKVKDKKDSQFRVLKELNEANEILSREFSELSDYYKKLAKEMV